ncbi:MAG TPA: cyclic lactone autoinducer peptide [Lachnospiraceae bacterium]|jgi:cyclic lactone autoinducer peptide|nr:cyclic lactone autoinducer peptide [Lachnospiraceae bacterium]
MKKVLNIVAKVGLKSAISAGNQISWLGAYQAKEPKELKKFKK